MEYYFEGIGYVFCDNIFAGIFSNMFLDLIKLLNERIYNRDNCRSEGKHVYRYLKISFNFTFTVAVENQF
jgi:hypothetical protein